jgi:hypothetical protein
MEWCVPIQTFQVNRVQIGETVSSGLKPTISISYKDNDIVFSSLNILLPSIKIKSYTPSTGRLILSLDEHPTVLHKITALHNMIVDAVFLNQQKWFPNQPYMKKMSEIKNSIQSMITNSEINLYCPLNDTDIHGPNIYFENEWSQGAIEPGLLSPGRKVRIVLKINGVSFHIYRTTDQWSGKFRLQHRIISLLVS